ncbi:hypothetical protein [Tenacibaculum ovolyticum]|uniref:hypothetical protein n=1 Tax=Tenacibaculum ovolyticum TaxID=104270 RepID=UPI0007EC6B61|nr:hypothetical protein [Tenacibaculum ovolyticum]
MAKEQNKKPGISNADILEDFNIGMSPVNKNISKDKEKPIVSKTRLVNENKNKAFLYKDVKDKSNNAVYLSGSAHENLNKLAYLTDLNIRQLATNIIDEFFEKEKEYINKLVEEKFKI